MSGGILSNTIFQVYEIFANIIPGLIIFGSIDYIFLISKKIHASNIFQSSNSFYLVLVLIIAFSIGQAVQLLGSTIGNRVLKCKYGGYPSSTLMNENNKIFPNEFKIGIKKSLFDTYGVPITSDSQYFFDLCYTYVVQKKISQRVTTFLHMYTFSRNMMGTMIFESIFGLYLAVNSNKLIFLYPTIVSVVFIYVFYKRFLTYSDSFVREVFRSYFIDAVSK